MKKIDEYYILAGLLWLVAGMCFGIWLGASGNLQFANSHAHTGLLGFTVSTLFGMTYRFWPAMKLSKMAKPQFWIYEVGALLTVAGKIRVDATGHEDLVAFGSVVTVTGALLMIFVFVRDREPVKPGL